MFGMVSTRSPGPFLLNYLHLVSPQGTQLVPPWVKDLAFLFAELPDLPVSPFVHTFKEPLDGSTALLCTCHPSQLHTTSTADESSLCSIIQIISEDVEQG